ncbi:hypothetical protein HID58_040407 [Brassica napus]|uniref:Non-haem dioxygenase N-terminal domain-containing protein n=1 Tax=Brassica napus TaxID=3708 RepID=A0ABQ8B7X9_BRANA|nr:hypothetical protein HID58_040407 [Brassica napus]
MEREMEIPVIDFSRLDGEKRNKTMSLLDHACDKWGFFMKVKKLINSHYEEHLKEKFHQSEMVKALSEGKTSDADWESTFFIWHKPTSNISKVPNISDELIKTMDEYVSQLHKFAERLSKLMTHNEKVQFLSNGRYVQECCTLCDDDEEGNSTAIVAEWLLVPRLPKALFNHNHNSYNEEKMENGDFV